MNKLMKIFFVMIVFVFTVEAKADFQKGLDAYDTGRYEDAFKEWLESAEAGDLAAQRNIGQLYRWGRGVEKSSEKAFYWYKRAANKGFAEAEYSLALMYLIGEGTEKNEKEAVSLLRSAAKKGSYNAEKKLVEIEDLVNKIDTDAVVATKTNENSGVVDVALKKIVTPTAITPTKTLTLDLKDEKKETTVVVENQPENKEAKAEVEIALKEEKTIASEPKKIEAKKDKVAVSGKNSKIAKKEISKKSDVKELTAHLASYRDTKHAEIGLDELSKKFKSIKGLKSSMRYIYLDGKGEFIRLYVIGKADVINALCAEMTNKKAYCKIEK